MKQIPYALVGLPDVGFKPSNAPRAFRRAVLKYRLIQRVAMMWGIRPELTETFVNDLQRPVPDQQQPMPAPTDAMDPWADHGEMSDRGSARLGARIILTSADSGHEENPDRVNGTV